MVTEAIAPEMSVDPVPIEVKLQEQYDQEEQRLQSLKQSLTDCVNNPNTTYDLATLTAEFSQLTATHQETYTKLNAGEITREKDKICSVLGQMFTASRLEELLGEPIRNAVYMAGAPSEDHPNGYAVLLINQSVNRAGKTGIPSKAKASSNGHRSRARIRLSNGSDEMTARDFIARYAPEHILNHSLVKYDPVTQEFGGRWPTKEEFVQETIEAVKATFGETWSVI